MKIHLLVLAQAFSALAQPMDEEAIRQLTAHFHEKLARDDTAGAAALFTADADLWDFRGVLFAPDPGGRLPESVRVHSGRQAIQRGLQKPAPFRELSGPYLQSQKVRMITPSVALVDVRANYYGSTITRLEMYGLMIAKKEAEGWRIASYRFLTPGFPAP